MAVINMRGGWTPGPSPRHIYKAPGVVASQYQVSGRRGMVTERLRGEPTPDLIIGLGRSVSNHVEQLEAVVAHKAAEVALSGMLDKSTTMVELDAVVAEKEYALAGSLGETALQEAGVERELVGANRG